MIYFELNKKLINDFKENGFIVFDKFINLEYLDKLKKKSNFFFKVNLKQAFFQMSGIGNLVLILKM